MSAKKTRRLSASFILFLMSLAFFLIFAVITAAFFAFDIFFARSDDGAPSVYLFNGDKKIRLLGEDEIMIRDGVPLIALETLSEYCAYGISGDSETRAAVFPDGNFAEFSRSSSFNLDGDNRFLETECVMKNNSFFVPISFFEEYVKGLHFTRSEDLTKLYIDVAASDYSLISYSSLPENALSASDYFDAVNAGRTAPEFRTDLSEYEEYMNPANRDRFLFLVNTENRLDKDYKPAQLTDLIHTRKDGRTTQQLDLYAAKAMEAMLKEAAANGYTSLSITSGYRSYNYQQVLFNNQVAALRSSYGDAAEQKAAEAVALPGTSEHQSGLCADLHNLPAASVRFADTEEYAWLMENCAKFGFILRYPKNKTEITGIMFEPWHYRYVGRYHAERIMQAGICLEEYMQMISDGGETP